MGEIQDSRSTQTLFFASIALAGALATGLQNSPAFLSKTNQDQYIMDRRAYKYGETETEVTSKINVRTETAENTLLNFAAKLIDGQKSLDQDIARHIEENFFELI